MPYAPDTLSLVADVGGTNTRVALARGSTLLTDSVKKYPNADFSGLDMVLESFVAAHKVDCTAAAVAIAGPVRDGRGTLTNLDWSMDEHTLAQVTKAETVAVLNDLQAQGHAIGRIASDNLRTVVKGAEAPDAATRLVIGIGTGFNAAVIYDTPFGRVVPPSEAGHINMPIRTDMDMRLHKFVTKEHGFPAVEDVLSGRGLENIYAWRQFENGSKAGKSAADIMSSINSDDVARATVDHFVKLMATVAGNLALVHLPFGGIYLIGGVSRAMIPHFEHSGFEMAFKDKGRFEPFMSAFRVEIVVDDFAALSGLAAHLDGLVATRQKMAAFE